jgi:hypothetical protein
MGSGEEEDNGEGEAPTMVAGLSSFVVSDLDFETCI